MTTGAIYRRYNGKAALFGDVVKPALDMFERLAGSAFALNEKRRAAGRMNESWTQSLETLQLAFKKIYEQRDLVKILLTKSDGTVYADFLHDFIEENFSKSYQFMVDLEKRGMCKLKLTYLEYHILLTSFWMAIAEVVIHDFTLDEALAFAEKITLFYAWDKLIEF